MVHAKAFAHGGNNKVSLNRVSGVMELLNDGAGLYIVGDQPGIVVERNVFHDIVKRPAHQTDIDIWGIYLDGTSRNMVVQNNLTYRIASKTAASC